MSYCRWSSDKFKSDVYVYEDVLGGYMVHTCNHKYVFHPDHPYPSFPLNTSRDNLKEYLRQYRSAMDNAELVEMKSATDYLGKTWNFPTLRETIDFLLCLRSNGLHVPDVAIEVMEQEIEEGFE